MTELLKTLYWNLYTPYENQETEQELDDCHKQLIEVLGKPERKLVLRIIDGKTDWLMKSVWTASSLVSNWQHSWHMN